MTCPEREERVMEPGKAGERLVVVVATSCSARVVERGTNEEDVAEVLVLRVGIVV